MKTERNTRGLYGIGLLISIRVETFSKVAKMISESKVVVLSAVKNVPFSN